MRERDIRNLEFLTRVTSYKLYLLNERVHFLFGFTIILVAPGVTILPPEITRRAVLFGVKFCLGEKPLSSPLPSAGLCADPRSRVRLAFVLPYAVVIETAA